MHLVCYYLVTGMLFSNLHERHIMTLFSTTLFPRVSIIYSKEYGPTLYRIFCHHNPRNLDFTTSVQLKGICSEFSIFCFLLCIKVHLPNSLIKNIELQCFHTNRKHLYNAALWGKVGLWFCGSDQSPFYR